MWIGAALFVVCGIAAFIMRYWLVEYRTDLAPGQSPDAGSSIFPQLNYMNPANYTAEGIKRLRWLYALTVVAILGGFAMGIGWVHHWGTPAGKVDQIAAVPQALSKGLVPERNAHNIFWVGGLVFGVATIGLWASSHLGIRSRRWSRVGVVFFSVVAAVAMGVMLHAILS